MAGKGKYGNPHLNGVFVLNLLTRSRKANICSFNVNTPDGKDNPAGRALNRRTEFKIIGEVKPEDKPKQPNKIEHEVKPAGPMPKVVKKDLAPTKTTGSVKSNPAPAAKAEIKTAPVLKPVSNEPAAVTGTVYIEKAGTRSVANQAAVFLSSNEGGYQQKVFYVKADGGYSFDLTHAVADTFRLIARKYQFESNEVVFTANDIRTSTKPINLVIKMK